MEAERFFGALVATPWARWSFWDSVDVSREQLHLRPSLRKSIVLKRAQVEYVGFEKDWRPFTWATNVRFHLVGGAMVPKVFVPASTRRLRATLEEHGWRTRDEVVVRGRVSRVGPEGGDQ